MAGRNSSTRKPGALGILTVCLQICGIVLSFQNCAPLSAELNIRSLPIVKRLMAPPTFAVAQLSNQNRAFPGSMMGGWGPALRGVMRNSKDKLYFAFEVGPTPTEISQIKYFTKDDQSWTEVASQVAPAGIQQNLAHVMIQERYVMSYGISSSGDHKIYQCYIDTENLASRSCTPVAVGGVELVVNPSANHLGAAIESNGFSRVVWWNTPGSESRAGIWSYIYFNGTDWLGPYPIPLPSGYTNLSFVHGRFLYPGQFVGVGELLKGVSDPSNAHFEAGLIRFRLGQSHAISPLLPVVGDNERGVHVISSSDIAYDPAGKQLHILARTGDFRNAYFREKVTNVDDIPSGGYHAKAYIPDSFRARFHFGMNGPRLLWGPAAEPILRILDLTKLDLTTNPRRIDPSLFYEVDPTFDIEVGLNAIYVESSSYSSRPIRELEAVVCGPAEGEDMILKSVSEKYN